MLRSTFYVNEILKEWNIPFSARQVKVPYENILVIITASEDKSFLDLALKADLIEHSFTNWYNIRVKQITIK